MSFIEISKELFETSTVTLQPQVHFVSSSGGEYPTTGSAYVAPVRSKCIKTLDPLSPDQLKDLQNKRIIGTFDLQDYAVLIALQLVNEGVRRDNKTFHAGIDISSYMSRYLEAVNDSRKDVRFSKFLDVFRYDAPLKFNMCHVEKRIVNNILQPYYQHRYPDSGLHYTNYNSINFFY